MQYTNNLNLKKPDLNDYVNVSDLNDNMDILDEKITEISDSSSGVEQQLTEHLDDDGHLKTGERETWNNHLEKTATKSEYGHIMIGDTLKTSNGITDVDFTATPSDAIKANSTTVVSIKPTAANQLVKAKEMKMTVGGTVRIEYKIRSANYISCHGQIYINGTPVGEVKITSYNNSIVFAQDLDIKKDDLIQMYIWSDNWNYFIYCDYLKISYDLVVTAVSPIISIEKGI